MRSMVASILPCALPFQASVYTPERIRPSPLCHLRLHQCGRTVCAMRPEGMFDVVWLQAWCIATAQSLMSMMKIVCW